MNKNFETWARDMAPTMSPDEVSRKAHLAVLKDRMRTMEMARQHRRARVRKASMVAVFVCVTLLGGYVSELGSDNYEVSNIQHNVKPGVDLVQHGHARHSVAGPSLDPEMTREWVEQDEAGLGRPVRCFMIEIDGEQFWVAYAAFQIKGQEEIQNTDIRDREVVLSDKTQDFMAGPYRGWMKEIRDGTVADEGTFYEVIDGHRYLCRIFTREFPEYGLVKMYRGKYAPTE